MGVYSFKYQIKSDSLHFITKRPLVRGSFQTAKRNCSRVSERVLVFNYVIQRLHSSLETGVKDVRQFGNCHEQEAKKPRSGESFSILGVSPSPTPPTPPSHALSNSDNRTLPAPQTQSRQYAPNRQCRLPRLRRSDWPCRPSTAWRSICRGK
jgi:hypothetical protein